MMITFLSALEAREDLFVFSMNLALERQYGTRLNPLFFILTVKRKHGDFVILEVMISLWRHGKTSR